MAKATAAKKQVTPGIDVLRRSWKLSLEAQNKSPRTITQYLDSLRLFERFLVEKGMPTAGRVNHPGTRRSVPG